jgi:hypothetical protein
MQAEVASIKSDAQLIRIALGIEEDLLLVWEDVPGTYAGHQRAVVEQIVAIIRDSIAQLERFSGGGV